MLKSRYYGMRVRPSMDQIVGLIENDPFKIRYPNRDASFIINSPYMLSTKDKGGIDLEEQSMNQKKFQMQEVADRMAGRGVADRVARDAGGVQDVTGDGDIAMGMFSPRSLQTANMYSRAKKGLLAFARQTKEYQRQEQERLKQEEFIRQQQEEFFQEQARKRENMARIANLQLGTVQRHPFAASSSSSSGGFMPTGVTPIPVAQQQPLFSSEQITRMLQQIQQGSLLVPGRQGSLLVPSQQNLPTQQDIPITYLQQQTGNTDLAMVPIGQQQQKRLLQPTEESPKAKAKAGPASASSSAAASSSAVASSSEVAKGPTSPRVKTKDKTLTTSKITSTDYGHWKSLTKRELYEQLVKYYGRKELSDSSYKQKKQEDFLEEAVKLVGLAGAPTATVSKRSSSYKPSGRK